MKLSFTESEDYPNTKYSLMLKDENSKLIGSISAYKDFSPFEHIFLKGLFIDYSYRRKGYGTKLMEVFIDKFRGYDGPIFLLDSIAYDVGSKSNYYEDFGFSYIDDEGYCILEHGYSKLAHSDLEKLIDYHDNLLFLG